MKRHIIINCFIVSLGVAIVATYLTMDVSYPTEKEIEVSNKIDYMIEHEWKEITDSKTLKKIEKFKNENPQKIVQLSSDGVTQTGFWFIFLHKFIVLFSSLIVATISVSYLNMKRNKNA